MFGAAAAAAAVWEQLECGRPGSATRNVPASPAPRRPGLQAEFQRLISVNLESAFALSQLAHPLLKAGGDGIVIFNSSVAGGPTAMGSGSIYGLTKVGHAAAGPVRCVVIYPADSMAVEPVWRRLRSLRQVLHAGGRTTGHCACIGAPLSFRPR